MLTARYIPAGIAAIDPLALAAEYAPLTVDSCTAAAPAAAALGIVAINGPLTYTLAAPQFFDTYDLIRARFDAVVATKPKTIALRIGSPGGDVSGAFECSRYMRDTAQAAGIKLIAHTEASMCSAAYVLACAASELYCTTTASVGSIGVIVQPISTAVAEAMAGVKVSIISSGERKADGNPHVLLSAESRAAIQQTVDVMAGVFFNHVGDARGSRLTAKAAEALQGGVRIGAEALAAGLVDEVVDFNVLAARYCDEACDSTGGTIAGVTHAAIAASQDSKASMADNDKDKDEKPKEDAVRASLVTASTSDDDKKAARAKAALAAYDSDEDDDSKKKKDEEAKASAAAAAAASAVTLAQVAAQANAAVTELAAMKAAAEATARATLFASRPDLPKAAIDAVRSLPVASAKAILDSFPVIVNPLAPVAVVANSGNPALPAVSALSIEQAAALDAQMGITKFAHNGVTVVGAVQTFGTTVPVTAGVTK